MSNEPNVLPLDVPSRGELWNRNQLALSLLAHRPYTAKTAWLVQHVLRGEYETVEEVGP